MRRIALVAGLSLAAFMTLLLPPTTARAQSAALAGKVTSAEEGVMVLMLMGAGCVIVYAALAVQLVVTSVTVTVYVPAARLDRS